MSEKANYAVYAEMGPAQREALRAVLDYLWEAERQDCEANPTKDHIFTKLLLLRELCQPHDHDTQTKSPDQALSHPNGGSHNLQMPGAEPVTTEEQSQRATKHDQTLKTYLVKVEETWRFAGHMSVDAISRKEAEYQAQEAFAAHAIRWDAGTRIHGHAIAQDCEQEEAQEQEIER